MVGGAKNQFTELLSTPNSDTLQCIEPTTPCATIPISNRPTVLKGVDRDLSGTPPSVPACVCDSTCVFLSSQLQKDCPRALSISSSAGGVGGIDPGRQIWSRQGQGSCFDVHTLFFI